MSAFQYPRHVKDLPKLEVESEDDSNTPHLKQNINNKENVMCNKENIDLQTHEESTPDDDHRQQAASYNLMVPKRRVELPSFDSDTEEDDNLNCAILNDSFLLSPGRCEPDSKDASFGTAEASISLDFQSLQVNEACKNAIKNDLRKTPKRIQVTQQSLDSGVPSSTRFTADASTQMQKPLTTDDDDDDDGDDDGTDDRRQQMQSAGHECHKICYSSECRKPRELYPVQNQRNHSAMVNEFRSQKVLYRTPMATSRPYNNSVPDDSISLSLYNVSHDSGTATSSFKQSDLEQIQQQNQNEENPREIYPSTPDTRQTERVFASDKKKDNNLLQINQIHYMLLQKLGCGGSSSVYSAKRCDNNHECAIKVVDLQGDPAVIQGYLNETRLLAKLQGNVCVVSLFHYQLLQNESKLFLVMEKGDSDLQKILQAYTTSLPLYVLVNLLYQMLQAVDYIHQNGVIHSDLKPANFLMINGRLKLIDFGIASSIALDSTSIIKFNQAGTFNYISPEALTDTSTGTSPMRTYQPKVKISTKSDVWSLGCILYLLLYQKTPFSHIKNIYAKISAISNPQHSIEYKTLPIYYPPMLLHMVKICLQHNPKLRPSCADLLKYPFHMIIPTQKLVLPHK